MLCNTWFVKIEVAPSERPPPSFLFPAFSHAKDLSCPSQPCRFPGHKAVISDVSLVGMGYHGNKLSAIGLAFTSLALFIALINGAVSVIKLGKLGPQGQISARWIRATAFLVIM